MHESKGFTCPLTNSRLMKHLKYKVIYSWSKRLKTLRRVMADISQVTQNTPQPAKALIALFGQYFDPRLQYFSSIKFWIWYQCVCKNSDKIWNCLRTTFCSSLRPEFLKYAWNAQILKPVTKSILLHGSDCWNWILVESLTDFFAARHAWKVPQSRTTTHNPTLHRGHLKNPTRSATLQWQQF